MSSSGTWVLHVDPAVDRFLRLIPRRDAERLLVAIAQLLADPFGGDIQKMKGERNVWRRRIGSYRVRYELFTAKRTIHVFRVERRTSTTYAR